MPLKRNIVAVSYNVLTAVDAKHKLIAHYDVINQRNDYALADMAIGAKNVLKAQQLQVPADKGFHTGAELARCQQAGIQTFVAVPKNPIFIKKGDYAKTAFQFVAYPQEGLQQLQLQKQEKQNQQTKKANKKKQAHQPQHQPTKGYYLCP